MIDTTTDHVRTTFALPDKNPVGFFAKTPASSTFAGDLLIPLVPSFDTYTTGCVARIRSGRHADGLVRDRPLEQRTRRLCQPGVSVRRQAVALRRGRRELRDGLGKAARRST